MNVRRRSCGPTLTEPTGIGCYFGTKDCGLRKVECNGELDVANPTATAATVQFTLTVVPSNVIPTLSGPPEVDIAFDDLDGTWATTWSAQPGNGNTFIVDSRWGILRRHLGLCRDCGSAPVDRSRKLSSGRSRREYGIVLV
jgi:hypothetical protein